MGKIDKQLRNLLMRQSETLMTSRKSCIYFGKKYTFDPVTKDEILEQTMRLLKAINHKSWSEIVYSWLTK